jgi:sporulation protein YlmC with PRC-barrel domain
MTQKKRMQELKGDPISARDGEIGSVKDLYFDDERWAVRYLVVDTGKWLPGRKVLIPPACIARDGDTDGAIHVDLTREQVKGAPGTEEDPPISRMLEIAHADYYDYPYYWAGPYLWGTVAVPGRGLRRASRGDEELRLMASKRAEQSHVRSGEELVGYAIRATDGELGHVEDFLVDEESWAITGMLVDTRNWLPGRKVVVPPDAISGVDWASKEVSVRLRRDELREAPSNRNNS